MRSYRLRLSRSGALSVGLLSILVAACGDTGAGDAPLAPAVDSMSAPLVRTGADQTTAREQKMELVFDSKVEETDDKKIITSEVAGELDAEQRDRVARPYRFVHERTLYAEEAWSRGDDSGVTTRGYRVFRYENTKPIDINAPTSGPPKVNDNVAQFVAQAAPTDALELDLKLRNMPEWNVPMAPTASDLSPVDVAAQARRRADAIAARDALFDRLAGSVIQQVESLGGRVKARHKKGGWLSVTVPAEGFERLAQNNALARIDGPYGKTLAVEWSLGAGREAAYLDADRFHTASFDGEAPNAARHAYGDITIGMNEPNGYEDGACAFKDGAGCTGASRIRDTYSCDDADNDGNLCEPGVVDTNTSDDAHGTLTTSVALGDYMDGQGNGKALNDGAWASSTCTTSAQCNGQPCEGGLCAHSSAWEKARTGMAPEASAVLFGHIKAGAEASSFTDMFDDSIDLNLDISSNSWTWGNLTCDIESSSTLEDEIENAYDDGVLVVFAAGNVNGDDATACQVRDPADTPKALTVNAYDAALADCANTPSTRCLLDKDSCNGNGCSARGGADAEVAGRGTIADAVSIVDLVAPNMISGVTSQTSGTDGNPSSNFAGTSAATPHVAGMAALVKDWYLTNGQSWVNSPGRLHTIMLAMGDRHFSSDPTSATTWTTQLAATPHDWYGVGRARLRLLENGGGLGNWGNHFATYTFTGQGSVVYHPFGMDPLPSGIELVKCVAMQAEDMSSKTDISEIKLSVRVLPNANGTSCSGTATSTRISDNFDTKKVAALRGSTFTDRCVEVTIDSENVTSQGVTVHAMCYYAGVNDDESL